MLDFLLKFPDLLHSAIVFGTVIMFGALGEIITEKSGNLNLGVPGIMYFGGIAGLTSTFMYENVYCVNAGIEPSAALCVIMCLVASFLASALGGLIYSFLTITLRQLLRREPQQARRRRRPGLRSRDLAGIPQLLAFPRQFL